MAKHSKKKPKASIGSTHDNTFGPDTDLTSILEATLKKNQKPLKVDDFLRILHLPRRQKRELEQNLLRLQGAGKVVRAPGGGFALAGNLKTVMGTLSVQKAGMGFLTTDKSGSDIYIHPAHMGDAWHGDKVEALILPGKTGRSAEGRIIKVLSRGFKEVAVYATKRQKNGNWISLPSSHRLQALFSVNVSELDRPVHREDLLLVKPGEKLGPGLWEAVASFNLEHEESPLAQERLTKSNNAIPDSFSQGVLKETKKLPDDPPEEDFAKRKDLRHVSFVTIDGSSAKDFDDAIFVEARGEGFRLMVAIADVSYYVRSGSALDNEARLRGNSYYFPLSVEPMLPEALSNGLCSLRPFRPRLVMVAEIAFSANGAVTGSSFYPAVIESKARLTYNQVHAALELKDQEERANLSHLMPMLEAADKLAHILAEARNARGSLNIELPEPEFFFDEKGNIEGIRPRAKFFAHRLIEEFMVVTNEMVARFITRHKQAMLYRIHPAPSEGKLEALFNLLKRSGLAIPTRKDKGKSLEPPTALDLRNILEQSRGGSQEYVINQLVLRSMMQAQYSITNESHYGLASECYCHFTSPIRRYADLTVHRSLKRILKSVGKAENTPEGKLEFGFSPNFLTNTATHINATERIAMEAEREIHKRLTVLFLREHLGEEFDGTVSGVTDFGFFVEMDTLMAEGMVRLSILGDDYYEFFPERQQLVGRTTNRSFTLGQRLRVKIMDVSLSRQEVNLALVEKQPTGKKSRSSGRQKNEQ